MSRNQNNGSWGGTIAGVAVGIGALAAIGYSFYDYYQQQQAESQQGANNRRRPGNNAERTSYNRATVLGESSRARAVDENTATSTSDSLSSEQTKCPVCGEQLSVESVFGLPCDHKFHISCIKANFVLHHHEDEFVCPINDCRRIVPEAVITHMFA